MLIENLIDHSLFPLKSSDTVEFALETMIPMKIEALPVVHNHEVKGFIDGTSLLDSPPEATIEELIQQHIAWVAHEKSYYLEALWRFNEFKAGCIAITDEENKFKGIVSRSSLINYMALSNTQNAEGSVICITMLARNYSLNELTRIIENDDAKILGVAIFNIPDSSRIILHLKLNTIYVDRIIAALQRFEFEVTASFYHNRDGNDFENRYNSLLKYLEF